MNDRRFVLRACLLLVAAACLGLSEPAVGTEVGKLISAVERSRALAPRTHPCTIHTIACNSTVTGTLTDHDCEVGDGIYADFWAFAGSNGQQVDISLGSGEFDTLLFLLDPTPEVVASDDDSGPGTDSFLSWELGQTGEWTIAVTNELAGDLGDYVLELDCASGPPAPACVPSETILCLRENRFQVEIEWRNQQGVLADAKVVPGVQSSDSGLFFFNNPNNWEFLIKVLNGCGFPDSHYWVFFAATTDVEFTVTVTDTKTGDEEIYTNEAGQAADAITDTTAFATCP